MQRKFTSRRPPPLSPLARPYRRFNKGAVLPLLLLLLLSGCACTGISFITLSGAEAGIRDRRSRRPLIEFQDTRERNHRRTFRRAVSIRKLCIRKFDLDSTIGRAPSAEWEKEEEEEEGGGKGSL